MQVVVNIDITFACGKRASLDKEFPCDDLVEIESFDSIDAYALKCMPNAIFVLQVRNKLFELSTETLVMQCSPVMVADKEIDAEECLGFLAEYGWTIEGEEPKPPNFFDGVEIPNGL